MKFMVKKAISVAGGYILGELAVHYIKKILDKAEEKKKVNDSEE